MPRQATRSSRSADYAERCALDGDSGTAAEPAHRAGNIVRDVGTRAERSRELLDEGTGSHLARRITDDQRHFSRAPPHARNEQLAKHSAQLARVIRGFELAAIDAN